MGTFASSACVMEMKERRRKRSGWGEARRGDTPPPLVAAVVRMANAASSNAIVRANPLHQPLSADLCDSERTILCYLVRKVFVMRKRESHTTLLNNGASVK